MGLVDIFKLKHIILQYQEKIRRWVSYIEFYDFIKYYKQISIFYTEFFNIIFGNQYLNLKSFKRSILFSLLSLVITELFFYICLNEKYIEEVRYINLYYGEFNYISSLILGILIANFISLNETRYIIKISQNKNILILILLLIIDVILTSIIYYVFAFGYMAYYVNSLDILFSIRGIEEISKTFVEFNLATPLLYSTFITSIIYYLFFTTSLLISIINTIQALIKKSLLILLNLKSKWFKIIIILFMILAIISTIYGLFF
ncbi:MAG: hypothetical protein EPN82_06015 [Bacteroidetes bacterium]|nr:MAG: hypothetical protein EPN82_06015 [Bacteroidota bacterium]